MCAIVIRSSKSSVSLETARMSSSIEVSTSLFFLKSVKSQDSTSTAAHLDDFNCMATVLAATRQKHNLCRSKQTEVFVLLK